MSVYPLIGLGGGGMSLEIVEKSATALSFDDVLKDLKGSAELSTGVFLFNLALGTDYLLKSERMRKEKVD